MRQGPYTDSSAGSARATAWGARSAAECLARCDAHVNCTFWDYNTTCRLRSGNLLPSNDTNAVGGPRHCRLNIEPCSVRTAWHKGQLLMDPNTGMEASWAAASAKECLAACNAEPECTHWDFAGETCRLRSSSGGEAKEDSTSIGGSKHCQLQDHADCWTRHDGYYVTEQLDDPALHECHDFAWAKAKCAQASDCFAITSQADICGGRYRVTHGGPTFKYFAGDAQAFNLHAYAVDRRCIPQNGNAAAHRLHRMVCVEDPPPAVPPGDVFTQTFAAGSTIELPGVGAKQDLCTGGIRSGAHCCAASCGACTSSWTDTCEWRVGGAELCCGAAMRRTCTGPGDVGCVIAEGRASNYLVFLEYAQAQSQARATIPDGANTTAAAPNNTAPAETAPTTLVRAVGASGSTPAAGGRFLRLANIPPGLVCQESAIVVEAFAADGTVIANALVTNSRQNAMGWCIGSSASRSSNTCSPSLTHHLVF